MHHFPFWAAPASVSDSQATQNASVATSSVVVRVARGGERGQAVRE
jgi:hypothetical protein